QITLGLSVTGMQRPVFWGVYMVNFIFFIGISHAGTLISAILRVTGAEWRRPITRVAEAITAFALVVGSLQIIIDMGRPDRLISVLLHGRLQSPILWDVVSVTAYFLGSITYLYLPLIPDVALLRDNFPEDGPAWRKRLYTLLSIGWRGNRTQWLRLEKAIGVMAILIIPIAVSVHTIISWILATTVQPSWHSTIFGPYFVVGAIFSGIGALFIAMTFVRRIMGLQEYITTRQYRNLGYIFITMNAVWAYFTYAEHLTLAAGQEINEFPILASKLWGEFSPGFWSMVALMAFAFWVMVAPQLVPTAAKKYPAFQPRFSYAAAAASIFTFYFISTQPPVHAAIGLENLSLRTLLWFLIIIELSIAGIGLALWLKPKPVDATLLAAIAVIIAMWLERWYIIVPTMTHPYLILFSQYNPTITEVALTAGSIALFLLLFLGFFKIFPIISIWEVAEGRVIEETRALHSVPLPTPSSPSRRFWERSFPKEKKI
ncbi:MAG: polysulfide reductase NrfD, partial [Anaerolineae bacterium]|nr:polysulfide reductase NrfD [Anaerolineae bacterium]